MSLTILVLIWKLKIIFSWNSWNLTAFGYWLAAISGPDGSIFKWQEQYLTSKTLFFPTMQCSFYFTREYVPLVESILSTGSRTQMAYQFNMWFSKTLINQHTWQTNKQTEFLYDVKLKRHISTGELLNRCFLFVNFIYLSNYLSVCLSYCLSVCLCLSAIYSYLSIYLS